MFRHSVRNAHGQMTFSDPGSDKPIAEHDTLQCCHCGGHFQVEPGSGNRRTFCTRCNGITCGQSACDPCKPFEKWLDEVEKKASFQARYGI